VPPEPAYPCAAAPWSKWRHGHETEFDLGVEEEEVMLLDSSRGWALSPAIDFGRRVDRIARGVV
jgi:hypothetical protein